MSTSATDIVQSYTGNASTTVFTFPAKFLDNDHLKVYLDGVAQTSGFTVSGGGSASGGSVTFTSAPASGVEVVIVNEPPLTQLLDLTFNGKMPSTSLENAYDKLTMLCQLLDKRTDQSLKFPIYDTANLPTDLTLANRQGKLLGFDTSSNAQVELVSRAQATYQSGDRMVFASVSALTTEASITSVSSGDVVLLTGYYVAGDFGSPIELIVEASTGGVKSHTLADGRYANLYADGPLNIKWFGAQDAEDNGSASTSTGDRNRDAFDEALGVINSVSSIDGMSVMRELHIPAGFYPVTALAGEDHCINISPRGSYTSTSIRITGDNPRNTWIYPVGSNPDFVMKFKGYSSQFTYLENFRINGNDNGFQAVTGIGFEQEDDTSNPYDGNFPIKIHMKEVVVNACSSYGIRWLPTGDGTLPSSHPSGGIYYVQNAEFFNCEVINIHDGVNAGTCIHFPEKLRVNTFTCEESKLTPKSSGIEDGTGIRIPQVWNGGVYKCDLAGARYLIDIGVDDEFQSYDNGPFNIVGNYMEFGYYNCVRVRGDADQLQIWGFHVNIKDNFITQSGQETYSTTTESATWNLTSCWGVIAGNSYSSKEDDKPKIQTVNCAGMVVFDQVHPRERYGESPKFVEDDKALRDTTAYWNFSVSGTLANLLTANPAKTFNATEDFMVVGPVIKLPADISADNHRILGISNNATNFSTGRPVMIRVTSAGQIDIQSRDSGASLESITTPLASGTASFIKEKGVRFSFGRRDGKLVFYLNDTCIWDAETIVAEVFDTVAFDADYFHIGGDSGANNNAPDGMRAWGLCGLYDGTLSEDDYFRFIRGQLDLDFATAGAKWLGVWNLSEGRAGLVFDKSGNDYDMTPDAQVTVANSEAVGVFRGRGTTANRPTVGLIAGDTYSDTDTASLITWDGVGWV